MLGLKIVTTGLIVAFMAGAIIRAIGKPAPRPEIAIPLIVAFIAGIMAIVGGVLTMIWQ